MSGKPIKQKDVQRGKIPRHLADSELIDCYKWFMLREVGQKVKKRPHGPKNKKDGWGKTPGHVFEAVRDNLLFKLTHQALLRGDDIRSEHVTWAHTGLLGVESGKQFSDAYIIYLDTYTLVLDSCIMALMFSLLLSLRFGWQRGSHVLCLQRFGEDGR